MSKLTDFQIDNDSLQIKFSESQNNFLNGISENFRKSNITNQPSANRPFYNIVLLNEIWVDQALNVLDFSQEDLNFENYEGIGLDFGALTHQCFIDMDSEEIVNIDKSLKCYLKLLLNFRNNPLEILSVISTFKDIFLQKKALIEFHKDLSRIFDLSGLMFNDDLTNENYYLKKNIQIIQIFDQIGFKEIFSGIDLSIDNEPRRFIFQNLSANYFLFMNLVIYMEERIPYLFGQFKENESFDLKNWQENFDSWHKNVNELVESISMPPKVNENQRNCISKTLDETDFGILSAYSGVDFIVDGNDYDFLGENEENRYTDAQQFITRLDFLDLFIACFFDVSHKLIENGYYAIYHSLQYIDGIEPAYKYLLEEMIMVEHDKWLPLYMINNPFMRDNIIISAKKKLIQINYDFKKRLILNSPLIVSENNLHNLEFVKELLKQDFNQYNSLPDEIKNLKDIKNLALKEAKKFLSTNVDEQYFSSEEYIKSILNFNDDDL
jgi:hypothetical protein